MKLQDSDQERLLKYYRQALFQYGEIDPRSVHWTTPYNQFERFQILMQIADLNNASVLDIGCGLGDFYPFLTKRFPTISYTGIDIVPDFIEIAEKKYSETNFIIGNILELPEKVQFDYCLASGALSFKVSDNLNYYQDMIRKMFSLARKGIAFNMLDNETHIDDATYAAYDPKEIGDFCKTLTEHVEILTGYMPQDFTVMMYRE